MPITESPLVVSYTDVEGSIFVPRDENGDIIEPAQITFTTEHPTLSTSSALRDKVRSIGYIRHRLEIEYAPMSKKDAHMLISLFELYQGAGKSFLFPIPNISANSIAAIQNANGRTMRNMPVFDTFDPVTGDTTGHIGDDVFVLLDGKVARFPSNLFVKFTNHDTVYKTTAPGIREADGRVAFRLNKPLEADIDGAGIVAREAYDDYTGHHTLMKVIIDQDEFEYGTNGAGLVVVKYKLTEDL